MFRDKDYLLTKDGLIFNVLGDQHEGGHVTAGLKYTKEGKWIDSYRDATHYLRDQYPAYFKEKIVVPLDQIEKHLKPLQRTRQLLNSTEEFAPRHRIALELIDVLAECCRIPPFEVGITDSLLWGEGNAQSDIDLVLYGSEVISDFQLKSKELFQFDDLEPIDPSFVQRPPDVDDATFETMLKRKANQGYFRGTRFSIRGALTDEEVLWSSERREPFHPVESQRRVLEISNCDDSLLFPVQYETSEGLPLVSYHIGYEMSFQPGDKVEVAGTLERSGDDQRMLVGSIRGEKESIRLVS